MNVDQWTKLLELLVSLLQIIIWPVIILFLLFPLRTSIRKLLEDGNISDFTFKASPTGGVEATFKRQQIEVASSLLQAEEQQKRDPQNVQTVATVVDQYITPQNFQRVLGKSILWVDDNPSNNLYERQALAKLGISVTICTSTDHALQLLREEGYDAIISDMGRPPDPQAGYTLLEKMQEMNISTPYIIYAAGGNDPEHQAEALKKGAFGSASGPSRLLELVMRALTGTYSQLLNLKK
jgi:CheY-like chemotaxis protein